LQLLSCWIICFSENQFRGIDKDEADFLGEIAARASNLEKQKKEEEEKELKEFRISFLSFIDKTVVYSSLQIGKFSAWMFLIFAPFFFAASCLSALFWWLIFARGIRAVCMFRQVVLL